MRPLADASGLEAGAVDPRWEPTSAIRAGDIITFRMPRDPRQSISHRVTRVIEDEGGRRFVTKGDASEREDVQQVPAENVVGTVVFAVPRLGYLADWLRHGRSYVLLVGAPTLVVVLGESLKVVRDIRGARASRRALLRGGTRHSFGRLVGA
jgi:signal peptidase